MTQIDLLSLLIGIAGTIVVQALLLTIGLLWAASDRNEYFEPLAMNEKHTE